MPILVFDTSVLIDLERGFLINAAFSLPHEWAVPDVLYNRELEKFDGELLIGLGLRVEELDENGVSSAIELRLNQPSLSLPDAFAITLADINGWILITGDKLLRELAKEHNTEYHGVLWVFDQMLDHKSTSVRLLRDGLIEIASHPRCRLPRREVEERVAQFEILIGKNN